MIRNNDVEAKEYLAQVYHQIMTISEKQDETVVLPSVEFRLQTSRFLVELEEFKKVIKILDTVIQEDDTIVECWYLLCFSFVKLKKFQNG